MKIESDVLLDRDTADEEWARLRIELDKEAAEESRRQRRGCLIHEVSQSVDVNESSGDTIDSADLSTLFLEPIEEHAIEGQNQAHIQSEQAINSSVTTRDFGEWTGISPRRIFEEACRARLVHRSTGW